MRTYGETWVRFRIQYYIYALMFVVFDIETVFLYPWAVSYAGLGAFALVEMVVFLVILLVGLVYAWAKGVLAVGLIGRVGSGVGRCGHAAGSRGGRQR